MNPEGVGSVTVVNAEGPPRTVVDVVSVTVVVGPTKEEDGKSYSVVTVTTTYESDAVVTNEVDVGTKTKYVGAAVTVLYVNVIGGHPDTVSTVGPVDCDALELTPVPEEAIDWDERLPTPVPDDAAD